MGNNKAHELNTQTTTPSSKCTDMAQRTVPYRTVLSVPLYGTIDVRYGKVAYRTGGVYGTVREILRTGS